MSLETEVKAISAATSGPETPNRMSVKRPITLAVWCSVGALAACLIFAAWIITILAYFPAWPQLESVTLRRLFFLGYMGLGLVACIPIVALSQFLFKIDASVGPAHITADIKDIAK